MKKAHCIVFPRFYADILSGRRTLFYAPLETRDWKVGDAIFMYMNSNGFPDRQGLLTSVRTVPLCDSIDADVGIMCVPDRAEFLARWDEAHPCARSSGNPLVCRIGFRYIPWGSDPAWRLAV